ncbi:MAG: dihydrofolate reductase [Porticoccaceae bacterium]|nr:MAG: dihydrofolate reductase [Porticoccaceae bacterium]
MTAVALVVACARNGVIGAGQGLPWHLPEDLRHFKAVTWGKPVVMGRKTFDSIGRPLPGRTLLVVTRNTEWSAPGVEVCPSPAAALRRGAQLAGPSGEVIVAGGGELYRACLDVADRIYLTEIDLEVPGDTYFPALDRSQWREVERRAGRSAGGIRYSFVTLERSRAPG